MSAAADRNLVFGLLAVQTGFIDRLTLHNAFNAWMANKSRALGDILLDQQALKPNERKYIDKLTDRCIANHDGDASRSLAGLDVAGMAKALLDDNSELNANWLDQVNLPADQHALPRGDASRFTVLRPHAKGGLGQVSIAYDRELSREVALKELQNHVADSPEVQARFLLEARVTSRLEHPGIVPMYGMGVGLDGRPFYVMRFIRGNTMQRSIENLHDKSKTFDERRRDLLQLLRQYVSICQTMAFAHARGVIHRDLKPANIVLGDFGETFVVDWGLAKQLPIADCRLPIEQDASAIENRPSEISANPSSAIRNPQMNSPLATPMATETGQMLGTPAFMSPEQAEGRWDALGPTSDIYSLGSILYAILTGRPPCVGTTQAVVAQVRQGVWQPPRQVNPHTPAPLDAICRKAIALNPEDRYQSATDIAVDIERWLADEPVSAWTEPLSVRGNRWIRRHRGWVAGGMALLLTTVIALMIGLFVVDQERRKTDEQRQQTQIALDAEAAQRKRTRQALDEMTSGVTADWLATQKELLPQQAQFLEQSLGYYREFANQQADDEAGRFLVAKAQMRVAMMLQKLGRIKEAESAFRGAIATWTLLSHPGMRQGDQETRRPGLPATTAPPHYRDLLAQCHNHLGSLLSSQGNKIAAEKSYGEAVVILDQLAGEFPLEPEYRQRLAETHRNFGVLFGSLGRFPESEANHRQALFIQEQLVIDWPTKLNYQSELAQGHNALGNVLFSQDKFEEAKAAYVAALRIRTILCERQPLILDYRRNLAKSNNNVAMVLDELGRTDEAEAAYRRMVGIFEKVAIDFPGVPDHQSDLAAGLYNLGTLLHDSGKISEIETIYERSRSLLEKLTAEYPTVISYRTRLADICIRLGMRLIDRGDAQKSFVWFDRASGLLRPILEQNPKLVRERERMSFVHQQRANALYQLKRNAEAESEWDEAKRVNRDPANAFMFLHWAKALAKSGNPKQAAAAVEDAMAAGKKKPKDVYWAACVLTSAVGPTDVDAADAQRMAARAVQLLRDSANRGYDVVQKMKSDPELANLRDRDDFRKLFDQLTANAKPEVGTSSEKH